ncbi:MAG: MOSC domain-containing protein [Chloroflexales bacterium]|nr:MOSC domain-containing protein [Chloroflexales bacterium]
MQIHALYIYPIKGCRGVSVNQAKVEDIGLADDRRYLVVDADGKFLSQRELPAMARIVVTATATGWQLASDNHAPLQITPFYTGITRLVTIWRNTSTVVDQGNDVAEWLSHVLGQPCRLVRMALGYRRHVDPKYATHPADAVSFADGYASLIANEASLADLNTRLATPIGMDRFRPNIVVSGATAWAEDQWHELQVGNVTMTAVKPCARCTVTTTDQLTGERSLEPLATLNTFRKQALGVIFGQNLVHGSSGIIHVGDPITLR